MRQSIDKLEEQVVLVDESDHPIGTAGKLQAHREGKLHRAFSIFVLNTQGELLLQRRARSKYHSGGLWTNTCCSHPRPNEPTEMAARRRLREEMGFECDLREIFSFIYRADLDNDLIEYEFDRVFVGFYNGNPNPNPNEVEDWQWLAIATLQQDIRQHPEHYTYWLRECLDRFAEVIAVCPV